MCTEFFSRNQIGVLYKVFGANPRVLEYNSLLHKPNPPKQKFLNQWRWVKFRVAAISSRQDLGASQFGKNKIIWGFNQVVILTLAQIQN
ncbi:hypothetical protein NSTC731_04566 [Nostoc sp. DSM 114167]|jgi:hypothetical protein